MLDQDYPLRKNYSGPCQYSKEKPRLQIKGYMNITHDEEVLKQALYKIGPLSIGLDFTGMFHYKSGVSNPRWCSTWPDHALVLVGYAFVAIALVALSKGGRLDNEVGCCRKDTEAHRCPHIKEQCYVSIIRSM